jgi:hypothetical protein
MICYPPEAEFWLISGGCELPCAFPTGHEQSQTEFDIFISRDLYFSRLIRGANCYKEPCSTDTAKKEILIFPARSKLWERLSLPKWEYLVEPGNARTSARA